MADDDQASRKRKFGGALKQGSQKRAKGDLGRRDFQKSRTDRRAQNDEEVERRQRREDRGERNYLPAPFPNDEIEAEERRPKYKVAVLFGYSGTGYRGLQINTSEKTIEGDLFTAFVEAKAISKANATDPKKSQLVRCARTDKGVHAAGNVLSLKLIIEDKDIVEKINSHLSPQIRVWNIVRTVNSFNSYQACDSRQYEYLIPTHSFIKPHPNTYLHKRLEELAEEAEDLEGYRSRQKELEGFWEKVEDEHIKPLLEQIPEKLKAKIVEALYETDHINTVDGESLDKPKLSDVKQDKPDEERPSLEERKALDAHIKALRSAYRGAKRAFRIPPERLARIQPLLDMFVGTKNFHNYTIDKPFRDPSAQRFIKSFKVNPTPIVIDGTEWLSIKVWGQSFMMHQIRKMIGMVALIIRCGAPPARIDESFTAVDMSLPKAPGIGLLLERPLFDSYNEKQAAKFGREPLSFELSEAAMDAFKQTEIYERIYREENQENQFHTYTTHVDNWRIESFLWLSSMGFKAVAREKARREAEAEAAQTASQSAPAEAEAEAEAETPVVADGNGDGTAAAAAAAASTSKAGEGEP